MSKLERTLENSSKDEAASCGFICLKLVALSRRGFPDRTFLGKTGHIFFVELKRENKPPQPHQIWWHKLLRRLGFRVYVIDNKEELKKILKAEAKMAGSQVSNKVHRSRF